MNKKQPIPKLTDAERHKRFVETAKRVEASEDGKDFDQAFSKVVQKEKIPNRGQENLPHDDKT